MPTKDKEVKELDALTKEELTKVSHVKGLMSQIGKLTREERVELYKGFDKLYWEENERFSMGAEFDAGKYDI